MGDRVKVLLATALVLALSACASQPLAETAEDSTAKKCMRETGTRIEDPEKKCVNAPGRVYTAKDLEQTGSATVGDALRRVGH